MNKYRDWDILDKIPDGWIIDNTAGSPAPNTVFITNGKSVLNGQKRALLKAQPIRVVNVEPSKVYISKVDTIEQESVVFPAKTVNDLARLKFKEQLLKEIMFDLMVCEIEYWDKKEYIKELKKLINGIDTSSKKNAEAISLFD